MNNKLHEKCFLTLEKRMLPKLSASLTCRIYEDKAVETDGLFRKTRMRNATSMEGHFAWNEHVLKGGKVNLYQIKNPKTTKL